MIVTLALPVIWHWLLCYGIALARPLAMLSLNPIFTRAQITGLLRGAIASVLALPMIPLLAAELPMAEQGMIPLLLITCKEAAVGAALGILLGAPFWALDVAGDILDAQRGATQGRLNDPAGFEDVSITGTLLALTAIALFVLTDGLNILTGQLYASWAVWRPLSGLPQFDERTPLLLLQFLDHLTRQGLLIAIPVVAAMLLADAGLLIVARMAPSMRIDDLALATRNVVFFLIMPLYAGFLLIYMRQDLARLPDVFATMRAAVSLPPATSPMSTP